IFELRGHFRFRQTEVRFIRQDESAKGRARDLFAATVWKIFQVSVEPMGKAERQRGDRSAELPKLRIHAARHRNVDAVFREAAAPDLRHESSRRTHADRGAESHFLAAVAGDERESSRAQLVVYLTENVVVCSRP